MLVVVRMAKNKKEYLRLRIYARFELPNGGRPRLVSSLLSSLIESPEMRSTISLEVDRRFPLLLSSGGGVEGAVGEAVGERRGHNFVAKVPILTPTLVPLLVLCPAFPLPPCCPSTPPSFHPPPSPVPRPDDAGDDSSSSAATTMTASSTSHSPT